MMAREQVPLDELRREHSEVVRPLLSRLNQMADLLEAGRAVSPTLLTEGIDLWEQYLHGVHRARLESLRSVKAMTCGPDLEDVLEDQERAQRRLSRLRGLLEAYRNGAAHGAIALALAIRSGTYVDEVWIRFEEEHPFSCLAKQLTGAEWNSIQRGFQGNDKALAVLETRIGEFLRNAIEVTPPLFEIRCNVDSCMSRAIVSSRDEHQSALLIGPVPAGWSVHAKEGEPGTASEGRARAFYCPLHAHRKAS